MRRASLLSYAAIIALACIGLSGLASAQTQNAPATEPAASDTAKKPPAKPAKPGAKPAAKEPAKTSAAAEKTAAPAVAGPAGRAPIPTTNTATNAKNATASAPAARTSPATAALASGSTASTQRSAVTAQGLHEFRSGQFTATAYGCTRSGTRVLCDFDVTRQNAAQTPANIWNNILLVEEGGKITRRHNAFFMFQDNSQGNEAYLSPTPVRMIMEFDGASATATSATLTVGRDRADGIPITAEQSANTGTAPQPAETAAPQQSAKPTSTGAAKPQSKP